MTAEEHTPVITLRDVSMQWDRRCVLDRVNLEINRGDFIIINGPNGGGKSTLLRIILKLLRPTRGTVMYSQPDGRPASRLHIGYLPQKNAIDSRFPITVREVIASGLLGSASDGMSAAQRAEAVEQTLDTISLRSHADASIGELSGGQLQRTLLGRAIVSQPHILVLDEPLSYLDTHFEQRVYDILAARPAHTTVIMVTHQSGPIDTLATRRLLVDTTLTE